MDNRSIKSVNDLMDTLKMGCELRVNHRMRYAYVFVTDIRASVKVGRHQSGDTVRITAADAAIKRGLLTSLPSHPEPANRDEFQISRYAPKAAQP